MPGRLGVAEVDLQAGLATGDAGPWAAWFDCTPTLRGDLVVFDTSSGQEVARAPIPPCRSAALPCTVDAIIGEHVYIGDNRLRLDVTTGEVVAATPQMLDEDLRSHPRAFDIVTGHPVEFRLPSGYHVDPTPTFRGNDVTGYVTVFTAFEWLDDDTVALTQEGEELANRDIITCRLSDGHCDVAVTAGPPTGGAW